MLLGAENKNRNVPCETHLYFKTIYVSGQPHSRTCIEHEKDYTQYEICYLRLEDAFDAESLQKKSMIRQKCMTMPHN